jgi:hypothetical protein
MGGWQEPTSEDPDVGHPVLFSADQTPVGSLMGREEQVTHMLQETLLLGTTWLRQFFEECTKRYIQRVMGGIIFG